MARGCIVALAGVLGLLALQALAAPGLLLGL